MNRVNSSFKVEFADEGPLAWKALLNLQQKSNFRNLFAITRPNQPLRFSWIHRKSCAARDFFYFRKNAKNPPFCLICRIQTGTVVGFRSLFCYELCNYLPMKCPFVCWLAILHSGWSDYMIYWRTWTASELLKYKSRETLFPIFLSPLHRPASLMHLSAWCGMDAGCSYLAPDLWIWMTGQSL